MRRRLLTALLLVAVGRLLSPDAVPVYDGIGAPDEPYRFVVAPPGSPTTAEPTRARATSPVVGGLSTYGLTVATAESGPQFSVFLPVGSVAVGGTRLVVDVIPSAPTDHPEKARIDGNVYTVVLTGSGTASLTAQAALATLYLRATTASQPPPVVQHRASADGPWQALETKRGGQDFYVAAFPGQGQYALAFADTPPDRASRLPYLILGVLLLAVVMVVVVRLRAAQ